MAPNKRKKKAANNTTRGFATVSTPSKVKDTPRHPGEVDNVSHADDSGVHVPNEKSSDISNCHTAISKIQEMSPEQLEAHLEDAELQSIIELNSNRCKQDAARQVSRLHNERRQLRSQSHRLANANGLSDEIINDILTMSSEQQASSLDERPGSLTDNTDLVLKLWTLNIVLTALKLTKIDAAIEHILLLASQNKLTSSVDHIWGLPEVLQWYAVECQQKELPDYEYGTVGNVSSFPDVLNDSSVAESATDGHDTQVVPSTHPTADSVLSEHESDQEKTAEVDLESLSPTDSEDDDPTSLTEKYIRFQTMLFYTEQQMKTSNKSSTSLGAREKRLRNRIGNIQRDVLFDSDDAGSIWNEKLRELRIDTLRVTKPEKVKSKAKNVQEGVADNSDEGDNLMANMFGTNEDEAQPQGEENGNHTVRVVDFGKWTGMQPRRLVEECCRTADVKSKIKFHTLITTSYSVRQKVSVWLSAAHTADEHAISAVPEELNCVVTPRMLSVEMMSVAASTAAQAEAYLSTIMFFLLVQSDIADHKQFHRLPTIWRNIYSDLSQARQLLVDIADKESLRQLRSLIHNVQHRLDTNKTSATSETDRLTIVPKLAKREVKDYQQFTAEEARAQWTTRASSSAFQSILQIRKQLPVYNYKEEILKGIEDNRLVIICADTGAGKSTQVPSFVLEHELSRGQDRRILVTQPRRISAISLARRVSQELGEPKNDLGTNRSLVGYAIRLESKTSKSTRITFATSGVLLRMIEASPRLEELDYLILDEVHERTMDIDLLFIALNRLQEKRPELKVILMSATVDALKFSNYFGGAPILNVPGRTFPVEISYLEDALEATLDIKTYGNNSTVYIDEEENDSGEIEKTTINAMGLENYSSKTRSKLAQLDEYRIDYEVIASLAEAIATKLEYVKYSSAILIFMPGIAEIRRLHNTILARSTFASNWVIHLLHSSFSTEDLERAFSIPPPGSRKIVIATNIAETGITIPDVTAVIDTCKEKIMRFDERRQLSRLTEGFIARSSARQRRGRAARVQEGLCFHLVTRYRFENLMLEQHVPEMLRLSLQDPILRIKVWNLGSIEETLAAAIDPPTARNVRRAIDKLQDAGALSSNEELTHLGKIIARLPLEVVLSKLAIFGIIFKCLDSILTIVAAVSSKSPFLPDKGQYQTSPRLAFARGDSDLISTLNAYQGWRKARAAASAHQFCRKHHLSDQNLLSIEDQKTQLIVYLVDAGLLTLDQQEKAALSRSRFSGKRQTFFVVPERYNTFDDDSMLCCVIAMSFYPKILVREGKGWRNVYSNQQMSLTSSSVNRAVDKPPKWLCFYEAMQTKSGSLNVLETSRVPEVVIATVLGSAEFRFFSGVVSLDNGRIKFNLRHWRQMAAIKILRESLVVVLNRCWQAPGLWMSPMDQAWMELFAEIAVGRDTKVK